jgi:hypothetical protein
VKVYQGNDKLREIVRYLYTDYHRDFTSLRVLGKGSLLSIHSLQEYSRRDEEGDDKAE